MLTAFEHTLGVRLPEAYRDHLLRHNGGRPERTVFDITWPGHAAPTLELWSEGTVDLFYALGSPVSSTDLAREYRTDRGTVPEDMLAIGTDPGGNPVLLGITGPNRGRVFFELRHEGSPDQRGPADTWDNVGFVAEDFTSFLAGLRPEE